MRDVKMLNQNFENGLKALGFYEDDSLFLTEVNSEKLDTHIKFHLEKARKFGATAAFLRKLFNGNYKPLAYLFDFTQKGFHSDVENEIALIQKKIWSSGEAPLACFFFDTEIKIIDCTRHVKSSDSNEYSPVYLEEHIKIVAKAHYLYNEQFAIKLKSGVFWDEEENKNRFKFSNNSAYDILISWIKKVTDVLIKENSEINKRIINKIIIQSILIKYLEEKKDDNEKNPFGDIYFHEFGDSQYFTEVLKKGKFVELLEKLNIDFNGNLFVWDDVEKTIVEGCNLNVLANALEGNSYYYGQLTIPFDDIRLYEFNYIPVELISRLYEEFLAGDKKEGEKKKNKQEEGIYYTPSHLAKLLVDEAMPLKNYEVDLKTFKILDPACGSGIFLVLAFKRLVQWWRLQNGIDTPRTNTILKELQKCVYGTDKEEQATQLAAFSLCLALCEELSPMQIINDLRFDDLTKANILHTDFFIEELKPKDDYDSKTIEKQKANFQKISSKKYDLIIGNPPFKTGGIKEYKNVWNFRNELKVKIPQGQIALKFLSESLPLLKENGIQCLIIKSSGLLYNSSSEDYKKLLFSRLNVIQIFDFTALAEGKSLWDNGARVGSAAIFLRNTEPDFKKNILHVTFRRTKAIRERIVFEIDDYDLHFVNRNTAINCEYIWKTNLLGGGRIKTVIDKARQLQSLKNYAKNADCTIEEGFEIGSNGSKEEEFMYEFPFLPTKAIDENTIHFEKLGKIGREVKFSKIPAKSVFEAPNIIVWENTGEKRFPIFFNDASFTFQRRLISIKSKQNNIEFLRSILNSFDVNYSFYKFYLLATSGETLINRNNTFLLKDFKDIPFISENAEFSDFDKNVITDSVEIMSEFFIHGETAKAVMTIPNREIESSIIKYGSEFCSVLNLMYEEGKKKFRLSEVVSYGNSFIATVFKYDEKSDEPQIHKNQSNFDIIELSDHHISLHLSTKRIIKLYPKKDTIVFIKPNQYRYWLSLIAYRDADKCFSDLAKANY